MYCIKCNREEDGNFCSLCGSKLISSKEAWNNWYYVFNGDRKGPISEAELLRLLESGHINENTQVWKQGLQNWVSIAQSGIVLPKKDETAPPPLTANQMNNKPIVFLLLVPIISTFMQYLIAGWLQVDANKLWWVAVGLNIICCTMDYYRVKKAGYNADKLMAAFVFLIPLYIYKRMALVKFLFRSREKLMDMSLIQFLNWIWICPLKFPACV